MAKAESTVTESAKSAPAAKGGMKSWLVIGVVGLVAAGSGVAVPMVFLKTPAKSSEPMEHAGDAKGENETKHESASREPAKKSAKRDMQDNQLAFVPFGEVVVNLAEEKLTRYLRISLTLQVDPANEDAVKKLVEKKKTILKNWLIAYLSDKALDEVRGAVGVNRARREIQDQFNRLLFPDGSDLIQDVLFEDFTVT